MRIEGPGDAMRIPSGPRPAAGARTEFAETLRAFVREADAEQKAAESAAVDLANERGDVVETMVALSKAELSLRAVTEARNRALEAFHEIMRLQV